MKKNLLLLILMLLPLAASADAVEIDGIYYNLDPTVNASQDARHVVTVTSQGARHGVTLMTFLP